MYRALEYLRHQPFYERLRVGAFSGVLIALLQIGTLWLCALIPGDPLWVAGTVFISVSLFGGWAAGYWFVPAKNGFTWLCLTDALVWQLLLVAQFIVGPLLPFEFFSSWIMLFLVLLNPALLALRVLLLWTGYFAGRHLRPGFKN